MRHLLTLAAACLLLVGVFLTTSLVPTIGTPEPQTTETANANLLIESAHALEILAADSNINDQLLDSLETCSGGADGVPCDTLPQTIDILPDGTHVLQYPDGHLEYQ